MMDGLLRMNDVETSFARSTPYASPLMVRGKPGETKCVCASGFQAVGSSVDEQGRLIELCEDIDECALYPCPTVEECKNTPGGFICTRDPTIATCPSGSKIVVTGPYSYKCECSWIYAGSDCRFQTALTIIFDPGNFLFEWELARNASNDLTRYYGGQLTMDFESLMSR
ncbi:unnamed protein product [Strongylus vulgaris]|uniref:EGF-like calcium-binding domain-containing protein n=1 Tax=Strongylus vulgaris TaxID=40348 RepID=A0A3P7JBE6_STRVU|nr:unnamed protein product [Strongylus vulgaris]